MTAPKLRFPTSDELEVSSWQEISLSNLAQEIFGGGTPPKQHTEYWSGNLPWISSSDLFLNDIHSIKLSKFITKEAVKNSATKKVPKGSVLVVSRVGVGKVALAKEDLYTSQDFTNIITPSCDSTFLAYSLSKMMAKKVTSVQGSAIKGIPSEEIKEYHIRVPRKEEQQKIAAFFTTLDEKIKLVENKLSKTRLLFETLIEKVIDKELTFNDGVCTAVPWKRMALKEVCKKISYGINAPAGEYNGCWKYIRITDIDEKTHKFNQHSPVSANIDHDQKLLTKYKVQTGDVLFARTGASVGKSYHYDPIDGNLVFAGFLIRCSLDLNKCNSYFVYLQTLTKRYSNWVKENSMRSGQPGLNSEQYGNFELVLPSLGEQDKIASFFKIFDKKISNLSFQLDVLKKQKQAFMREMFV